MPQPTPLRASVAGLFTTDILTKLGMTNSPVHSVPYTYSDHLLDGAKVGWCIAGLRASAIYGAHSVRRTKAARFIARQATLRAVQLLLGDTKLKSTVRYLGIEVDDALNMAEQIEL